MDFIDRLRELSKQIPKQVEHIRTEEATKSALVMPFIQALGYDIFNPAEVTPEFVADFGTKQGEKVDYVILQDGKPIMMFECKSVNANLDKLGPSQLFRYFSVSAARIGIFTNGIVYKLFSDLEQPNKMDATPFLELNMLGLEDTTVEEVKKLIKGVFEINAVLVSANEFKYTREIKRQLGAELLDPSVDFVTVFANRIYAGKKVTPTVKAQFAQYVKRAFGQFINDQINARLKSALVPETEEKTDNVAAVAAVPDKQVTTTAEELEAYYIIKAILRDTIPAARITLRDSLTYCSVLLDDNNRKPICRLFFNNTARKSIVFVDQQRNEEKTMIDSLDDIYKHSDRLRAQAALYDKKQTIAPPAGDQSPV